MSRQTLQEFCTAQKRPELLVEWDLERNAPLTPDDVTFASHKKVWWCCRNGHSWQTAVYTRSGGAGCPYCSGRSPRSGRGSILSECVPALADEWNSEKNAPLTPSQVTVGSHRVVWWHCPEGPRLPDICQIARARLRLSLLRRTSGLAGGKFSRCHCSGAAIRMGHGKERTADPRAGIGGDTPENMVAV